MINTEYVLFYDLFFLRRKSPVFTYPKKSSLKSCMKEMRKRIIGAFPSPIPGQPQESWSPRAAPSEECDSGDTFSKVLIITQFAT